jgi:predicted Zn-dependent protease
MGHFEDARQALVRYSSLVDDDRDQPAHAAQIADLSLELNDVATAIRWYEKSEALGPADATQLVRLAEAQIKARRTHDAEATLARALTKDPTNPKATALMRRLQPVVPGATGARGPTAAGGATVAGGATSAETSTGTPAAAPPPPAPQAR